MALKRKDHFLLDARIGWRTGLLSRVETAVGVLRLRAQPGTGRRLADTAGTFGGLSLPTAIAVDRGGDIYILDGVAHALRRYDLCTETFTTLPCVGGCGAEPRELRDPHGIAISPRGDLHVADTGNRRVQVFALKSLALRQIWGPFKVIRHEDSTRSVEPASAAWRAPAGRGEDCMPRVAEFERGVWLPWDIAVGCDGRAFVSDYANGLIHVFDPHGCWVTAFSGKSAHSAPLRKPTHLAIDKRGHLYVLQEGQDYVTVIEANGDFVKRVERPEEVRGDFCPMSIGVDPEGNIYLSERVTRRVYRHFQGDCECGTVSGFAGDCASIAFDLSGNPLLGDAGNGCVVQLSDKVVFENEGSFLSEPLDSEIYQCRWHRLAMLAELPPGTQLRVDTFTSESLKTIAEIDGLPESRWATRQWNSQTTARDWDCLITSPPGRYLWLRLTLRGDGADTPRIESLRIYCPRNSSLRYLPAVYAEDPTGTDFPARFLSIFDSLRGKTNELIENIAAIFDPAAVPADGHDFLTWLAGWMGLSLDRHWPLAKRRELLRQAHRLYALRGTAAGLKLHLRLYTGSEPQILEHFKLRRWLYLGHGRLGDQSALFGAAVVRRLQLDEYASIGSFQLTDSGDPLRDPFHHYAHQFSVFVPVRGACSPVEKQTIERIVEMAKPAHALARIQILEPRFRVGTQAVLGLDTVIARYPQGVTVPGGKLGFDTLLGPSADEQQPPAMRVGQRSRIGSSTLIN